MMTFISAFVVCGGICLAGQLIYDNTKLTADISLLYLW